jgi:hypothetical protein
VSEHWIDLDVPAGTALVAVRQAAEDWGAELERDGSGGRLRLPVLNGLRRGLVTGSVAVEPTESGARVTFRPEQAVYYVQTHAVVILLLACFGALLTVVWPFYPKLLTAAPFGAILALGGWFLVISRLRTSGPDEFLEAVALQGESREEA